MDDGNEAAGARLGGLVRGWRRAAGLTQRELAVRSGLSVTAVRDLEQGRSHRPRPASLAALAGALGLDSGQAAVLTGTGADPVPAAVPGSGLWVAVLGPVAVWRDRAAVAVGPPGRRAVLAVLALSAGELVARETVIDILWGQQPPVTAAELVAAHVSRLRQVLDPAGDGAVLTGDGVAGYRLRAERVDAMEFVDLARLAAAACEDAAACGFYEQALGLWRGEPAGDVAVLRGHPAVTALLRRRAEVVAAYAQAACGLGWHERVIPLLEAAARAEPLNERVHARLMVALAGTGRQADAVAVFEGLRRRLDEELGVYPGAELAGAHQRVLRQDIPAPAVGPAAGPAATMRTLPRDVAAFTGRDAELRRLVTAAAGAGGVVVIHAVDGMPGVGKTALVTHAAHLLAGDFPDGQLFVDLHAHTPGVRAADPAEVLAGLLACTGMAPREIPAGLEARAERWRGRVAGRRVLLVLDDAAGHAQVEPLLPGTDGCLVLVTSRRRLVALPGAQPLALDTLPPGQAAELFARLCGHAPDGPAAGAVAELTRLCGYLPLAIALLAGRLAHHPSWTISGLAADFTASRDRLGKLAAGDHPGDPAVTAAFQMSYAGLPAGPQRLFCLLGLHPGADIDAYATAALAGVPFARARQDLNVLYDGHLIDEPAPGRYRLHDLLREYARTLITRHDPAPDRSQAIDRLLDYYQHTAQTADHRLTRPGPPSAIITSAAAPGLPDQAAALAWFRAEHANLLACIGYATATDQPGRIIALTADMADFLSQAGHWQQAAGLHQAAATTARHDGDRPGEASALHDLGFIRFLTGDHPAATDLLERALAMHQDLGNRLGEASALHDLGRIRLLTGDHPAATDLFERALAMHQDLGNRLGEADDLYDLGRIRFATGDYPAATDLLEQALAIHQELDNRLGEANDLYNLGRIRFQTGDYPAAIDLQQRALAIHQDLGNRLGEANDLYDLGSIRFQTGDYPAATDLLEQALAIHQDLDNRLGEANVFYALAYIRELTGDYPAATDLLERALATYQDLGNRLGEANDLNALGRIRELTGDYPAATDLLERALATYQDLGNRLGEANSLNNLGRIRCQAGDYAAATDLLERAQGICQDLGHREGEAGALCDLGRIRHLTGDYAAATDLLERSLALFREVGDVPGEAEVLNATGALLAVSTGPEEALTTYQRALLLARQASSPMEEARALEGAARCMARVGGDLAAACAHLSEAVMIYQRIGAAEAEPASACLAAMK